MLDPFHVVRLDTKALNQCRRRVQQQLHSHRSHKNNPLYKARRTLHTGKDLITDQQREHLNALLTNKDHIEVEATWDIPQQTITAYPNPNPDPDPAEGKQAITAAIHALKERIPTTPSQLRQPGPTLNKPARDIHAHFDQPATSNEPTEAINSQLEHPPSPTPDSHNLTNYTTHNPLKTAESRPHLHP